MALCRMPDARILVANKLLQVQRKRAPEPGSSCRCPQFEKDSTDGWWIMSCWYVLLPFNWFTFMVILTVLCFVIRLCCSRFCMDDVNLNLSPAMAKLCFKCKFCMMIMMFSDVFQDLTISSTWTLLQRQIRCWTWPNPRQAQQVRSRVAVRTWVPNVIVQQWTEWRDHCITLNKYIWCSFWRMNGSMGYQTRFYLSVNLKKPVTKLRFISNKSVLHLPSSS